MKKGVVFGSFDLIHPGYVQLFEFCKQYCDILIVGLQVDPSIDRKEKNKPCQSIFERQVVLKSIRQVDDIVVYQNDYEIEEIIHFYRLQVRFLGADYIGRPGSIIGFDLCRRLKIEIIYCNRDHEWSTSELRKRIANLEYSKKLEEWRAKQ